MSIKNETMYYGQTLRLMGSHSSAYIYTVHVHRAKKYVGIHMPIYVLVRPVSTFREGAASETQ